MARLQPDFESFGGNGTRIDARRLDPLSPCISLDSHGCYCCSGGSERETGNHSNVGLNGLSSENFLQLTGRFHVSSATLTTSIAVCPSAAFRVVSPTGPAVSPRATESSQGRGNLEQNAEGGISQ